MRKTSCSRQFACSCTSMQPFENRFRTVGSNGTWSLAQISSANSGWALPLKIAIGPTDRLLLLVPPPDYRLAKVVFVAEDTDAGGIQHEMCSAGGRQAEPASRQHPQEMRAGKDQYLAVELTELS